MYVRILLWTMLILPPTATVIAVVRLRGFRLIGTLFGIAIAGYVLMVWYAVADTNAYAATLPKDKEVCGMFAGLTFLYGWIYSGIYVAGCAALTYSGIGLAKLAKYILANLRLRHNPSAP